MKSFGYLAVVTGVLFSQVTWSRPPVVYGLDNRVEVFEATPFEQKLARSALTMVPQSSMILTSSSAQLNQTTLKDWLESPNEEKSRFRPGVKAASDGGVHFCDGERFIEQPNPGMCSGFLIAPDLIVTAGHCAETSGFCEENSWVFGFAVDPKTKKAGVDIKAQDVYQCKKVISSNFQAIVGLDYAIVQLDRKVTGREPLEIRLEDKIETNAELIIIGSPSGLPLKVAPGARVRENKDSHFFVANLDSFQGNSGSGVFDAKTGVVEGILVRGEEDYVSTFKDDSLCIEVKKCEDDKCRGEDVTRLATIPEIGVKSVLDRAARDGDMINLEKILKLNFWVDFYAKDGVTALMNASNGKKNNAVAALIARGADVNLQDSEGETPLHHLAKVLGPLSQDVLKTLLAAKANLELKNNQGETVLGKAAANLNLNGTKILIANGAQKNTLNNQGETILFSFVRAKNIKAAKELITLGVDATVKNVSGFDIFSLKDNQGRRIMKKFLIF